MRANALVIMAKAPVAGQVKTRLLPGLSAERAARLAKALLVDQLNHVRQVESADLYLAFAPEEARLLMEQLAPPLFGKEDPGALKLHATPRSWDVLGQPV